LTLLEGDRYTAARLSEQAAGLLVRTAVTAERKLTRWNSNRRISFNSA